jgi:hypothetical protein
MNASYTKLDNNSKGNAFGGDIITESYFTVNRDKDAGTVNRDKDAGGSGDVYWIALGY